MRIFVSVRCAEVGGGPVRGHELVPGAREGARGVELREDGEPRVPPHRAAPEAGTRRGGSPAEEADPPRYWYDARIL